MLWSIASFLLQKYNKKLYIRAWEKARKALAKGEGLFLRALTSVNAIKNQEPAAALPRREVHDFCAFPPGVRDADGGAKAAKRHLVQFEKPLPKAKGFSCAR